MPRDRRARRAIGEPRRTGRRPLLTPEIEQCFLANVRNGAPLNRSALAAGVSDRTVMRWIARGEVEEQRHAEEIAAREDPDHPQHGQPIDTDPVEEPFRAFCQRTAHARAEAMMKALTYVDTAARGGFVTKEKTKTWYENGEQVSETETTYAAPEWRAATWLLERSFHSDFGKDATLDVTLTGPDGGPVLVEDVSPEVLAVANRLTSVLSARQQEVLEAGVEDADVVEGEVVPNTPRASA